MISMLIRRGKPHKRTNYRRQGFRLKSRQTDRRIPGRWTDRRADNRWRDRRWRGGRGRPCVVVCCCAARWTGNQWLPLRSSPPSLSPFMLLFLPTCPLHQPSLSLSVPASVFFSSLSLHAFLHSIIFAFVLHHLPFTLNAYPLPPLHLPTSLFASCVSTFSYFPSFYLPPFPALSCVPSGSYSSLLISCGSGFVKTPSFILF